MQALESFDGGNGAPVDGFDVPDTNGPQHAAYAVPEQTDGNDAQDNGGWLQRQVVEEVLGRENGDAGSGVGGRGGGDGTDCVLLEVPRPGIEEAHDADSSRQITLTAPSSPSKLLMITSREHGGPGFADEIGDEDDEGAGNADARRFELCGGHGKVQSALGKS